MPSELVTIAAFDTPAAANIARNYLEAAGFQAQLANEEIVAMYWIASNAYGGIRLQVPLDQAAAAREALDHHQAGFVEQPGELPTEHADAIAFDDAAFEEEPIVTSPGDELAARAFRAALFGFLVLPPLLNIYSVLLLFKLAWSDGELSAGSTRKVWAAMILDGIVIAVMLLVVRAILI